MPFAVRILVFSADSNGPTANLIILGNSLVDVSSYTPVAFNFLHGEWKSPIRLTLTETETLTITVGLHTHTH
jgi:hypothetical protein